MECGRRVNHSGWDRKNSRIVRLLHPKLDKLFGSFANICCFWIICHFFLHIFPISQLILFAFCFDIGTAVNVQPVEMFNNFVWIWRPYQNSENFPFLAICKVHCDEVNAFACVYIVVRSLHICKWIIHIYLLSIFKSSSWSSICNLMIIVYVSEQTTFQNIIKLACQLPNYRYLKIQKFTPLLHLLEHEKRIL